MEFTARIKMDNAAFEDAPASEIGRILRHIAEDIECGVMNNRAGALPVYDINGNRVGEWRIDS